MCHPSVHGMAEATTPNLNPRKTTSVPAPWCLVAYVTVRLVHGHHSERIFSQFCPSLLAAAPLSVLKVTSRGEREAQRKRGRKEEGSVGGTRSRTQEVEKDEEPGDNVMHRGAEPEGEEEEEEGGGVVREKGGEREKSGRRR